MSCTLYSHLKKAAQNAPDKHFLGNADHRYTYGEALGIVASGARTLAGLGIRPGDLAALRADRSAETALMILTLRAAGAVVVLTDPRQSVEEALAECSCDIRPVLCVERKGGREYSCTLSGRTTVLGLFEQTEQSPLPEVSETDPAFVIFTSGSTGKSKGVVLSEENLISNLLDSAPLGYYSRDDIALGALPLTHVFGLALLTGAVVLEYGIFFPERVTVPDLLDCIEQEKITRMNGVPPLYLALADNAAGRDLSSLRAGFIGGGPVTEIQFAYIEEVLGMTLISVYGMSECIGISCSSYKDPREVRALGVGPVYPMNEIRIVDEKGCEVPCYAEGEIYVRGPMRMIGYFHRPLPPEEFFRTGDLGYLDEEGVLHLSGRKKEIIIRNGNNLSPRRIEDAFLAQPSVRAAAVVGLSDAKEGEVPAAMVVGTFEEERLRSSLHKNEWPVLVVTRDALPLTSSGKPDKIRIKEELLACLHG